MVIKSMMGVGMGSRGGGLSLWFLYLGEVRFRVRERKESGVCVMW